MKKTFKFLSYPESSDIDQLKADFDSHGWAWAVSPLHDKDTYQDDSDTHHKGDLKKPHYHWLIGFEKSPPNFTAFRDYLVKECGCAVPPVKDAVCINPADDYAYFTHDTNNARLQGKYQYDVKDIQQSPLFILDNLVTYVEKRASRSRDTLAEVQNILRLINDHQPPNLSVLTDLVSQQSPELLSTLSQRAYYFRCIIQDKVTRDSEIDSLHEKIEHNKECIISISDELSALNSYHTVLESRLKDLYEKLSGESVPVGFDMYDIVDYIYKTVTKL